MYKQVLSWFAGSLVTSAVRGGQVDLPLVSEKISSF